jgi:hypothetical protein
MAAAGLPLLPLVPPGLKKFKCLAGNYGGAWFKQKSEFAHFPGPILMTTNCIMPPPASYSDRIFTTGEVGVAGSPHIGGGPDGGPAKDFSPLIARALEMPGFTEEPAEPKTVTTGFAHNATLGAAGLVLDAIKVRRLRGWVPCRSICHRPAPPVLPGFSCCSLLPIHPHPAPSHPRPASCATSSWSAAATRPSPPAATTRKWPRDCRRTPSC